LIDTGIEDGAVILRISQVHNRRYWPACRRAGERSRFDRSISKEAKDENAAKPVA
jgi:hypothetical protein